MNLSRKLIMLLVLSVLLVLLPLSVSAESSGSCGEQATWTLTDDGLLTISGKGSITSDGASSRPWKTDVTSIVIEDGITTIGSLAFEGCQNLVNVSIPDTVTFIGSHAFENCTALTGVTIPGSVTEIGFDTFAGCSTLAKVELSDGIGKIYPSAFHGCSALTSIVIPDSVTYLGAVPEDRLVPYCGVFEDCTSLTEVKLSKSLTSLSLSLFKGCTSLASLEIPSSVTKIHQDAFSGCTSLTDVELAHGTTQIAYGFFADCTSLVNVIIPDSVTSIGEEAFSGCTSLKEIEIPDSVTEIGGFAFYRCSSLTSVKLPAGITCIPACLFSYCSSLTDVTIPDSVTRINWNAFSFCSALTGIEIPDTVTYLGDGVFAECTSLTDVNLPNGITSLFGSTFFGCRSLSQITIPDTVTSIGRSDFEGCTGLTEIVIPEGVTSIYDRAFAGCTGLTEVVIPDKVYNDQWDSNLGPEVFKDCTSLVRVTLSSKLNYIPNGLFSGCTSLTEVVIPDRVEEIGEYAFQNCTALTQLRMPETLNLEAWSRDTPPTIADNAFQDAVATIHYPSWDVRWFEPASKQYGGTLTWADNGTEPVDKEFRSGSCGSDSNDTKWTLSTLGKLTITGKGEMNPKLTEQLQSYYFIKDAVSIEIASGITNVIPELFRDYAFLKEIALPETVTTIGAKAFAGSALEKLTISAAFPTLGDGAFRDCTSLKEITFSSSAPISFNRNVFSGVQADVYYPAWNPTWTDEIRTGMGGELNWIDDGSEAVADTLFSGTCGSNLTWDISELGILTISGEGQMPQYDTNFNYAPWYAHRDIIFHAVVESDVTYIGSAAFYGCAALEDITFLGDGPSISYDAFKDLTLTVYYPAYFTWETVVGSNYSGTITYVRGDEEISTDPTILAQGHGANLSWKLDVEGTLTISGNSSMSRYFPRYEYPWAAYANQIKALVIEAGITDIPESAFASYPNLWKATLAEGVTAIGANAFQNSGLKYINIPDSMTSIGQGAFRSSALKSIVIPGSVATIQAWTFHSCSELESVVLSEGTTAIEEWAFFECKKLTGMTFPDGLSTIGMYAFYFCDGITSLQFGNGISYIDVDAFDLNFALKTIYFMGDAPTVNSAFSYNTITIYYPGGNRTWTGEIRSKFDGDITWEMFGVNADGATILASGSCGNNLSWTLTSDGTLTVSGRGDMADYKNVKDLPWKDIKGQVRSLVIEEGCTSIGDRAFWGFANLTSVKLPESITDIGYSSFYLCGSISSLTIPNGVTTIGDYAFANLDTVKELTIGSRVTSIGWCAFANCELLTGVTIPDSVTTIAGMPFGKCGSLTEIRTGAKNTHFITDESGALMNKSKSTLIQVPGGFSGTYTMPDSVTSITAGAFYECKNLTTAVLSEKVTVIPENAFSLCTNLKTITLPAGITKIAEGAFDQCTGLTSVYFTGSAPQFLGETNFDDVIANMYYPKDNASWTYSVMKDYGGFLTWLAFEEYGFTDGQESIWSQDSGDELIFRVDTDLEKFVELVIDNQTVDSEYYTLEEGSTIVKLKATFLSTLPTGDHQVTVVFEDGRAQTSFRIKAHEHRYESVVTEPTCTERGYTTHTCICGDSYVDSYVGARHHYENDFCTVCGAEAPEVELGDANGDGVIDNVDAMLVLQYAVGLIDGNVLYPDACDVDGDGDVDNVDAMLVLQYAVGLISSFIGM